MTAADQGVATTGAPIDTPAVFLSYSRTDQARARPVIDALIAAGFTMRHARFGKTGQMVLLALAGGFSIFFLRNFAQVLGDNGQIPVYLAAWSPPVAAILLSLGLLLHLEDG